MMIDILVMGFAKQIADYCGYKNAKSFAARYLKPLLESGQLKMTLLGTLRLIPHFGQGKTLSLRWGGRWMIAFIPHSEFRIPHSGRARENYPLYLSQR